METWLHIVVQQITLYLLPVIISMTVVAWLERRFCKQDIPHPFYAIGWQGLWFPLLASIAFTRALIVCLVRPLGYGFYAAWVRFLSHVLLMCIGFLLYTWSLAHQGSYGMPPIHFWWAKVLMFFNLCMLGLHALPLPNLLMGECLMRFQSSHTWIQRYATWMHEKRLIIVATLLAASPLLDMVLGAWLIYPVYAELATWAIKLQ